MLLFPEEIISKSTIFSEPSLRNQTIVVKNRLAKSSELIITKLSKGTIFPKPSLGNQAKAVF